MGAFTQAFYDRLFADATLTALLGTYNGAASIFTKTPIPNDFKIEDSGPYVVTTGQVIDLPGDYDTKNSGGRDIVRDIRCYTYIGASPTVVEAIAERVRALFHRYVLTVSGFTVEVAEVSGPVQADEDDVLGRVISVRLIMKTI